MKLSHIGRASVSVIDRCLVDVKMWGTNPSVLLNMINENKVINNNVLPGCMLGPINSLNSLCNVLVIMFHIIFVRDGISHIMVGIIIIPINVLIQFIDVFIIDDVGSNTENRFVIIFRFLLFLLALMI